MLYKLTDANDRTGPERACRWGEGITHTADGNGELCTEHWIHACTHPLIAVFMNPVHGDYNLETAHLWECEGEIGIDDNGLKCGVKELTAIKRVPLPVINLEQRVEIAIRVGSRVYKERKYQRWAKNWLSGKDRTVQSATSAALYATEYAGSAWSGIWFTWSTWCASLLSAHSSAWSAAQSAAGYAAGSAAEAVGYAAKKINILDVIKAVVNAQKEEVLCQFLTRS